MREFDPDNPMMHREMRDMNNEGSGAGLGALGLIAGLAIAVALGFFFFMNTDERTNTALNASPGTTTGWSTSPPSPSLPPNKDNNTATRENATPQ